MGQEQLNPLGYSMKICDAKREEKKTNEATLFGFGGPFLTWHHIIQPHIIPQLHKAPSNFFCGKMLTI